MKTSIKIVFLALLAILISSCASYNVAPENITRYDKGIDILDASKEDSKVQIEVSQHKLGGLSKSPLVIYVGAQITSGKDIIFDIDNLQATQNQNKLEILTYDQILHSSYDFTDILQDFGIPTPPVNNTNIYAPMLYFGRGGFLAYSLFFSPFFMDNIQNQQAIAEQAQARKILATNYLRKSTLSVEGKAKGGFIAIKPNKIKTGVIELKVFIREKPYIFKINITKSK
ncbi:hypothetical protein [Helicobacter cappadocius]|uniref:Lipoprotein n=1 Tax=Helicobacter cappadocius TaxID=3063998 RepID=A0AA90Q3I8_9HELI|nr:MULTISPECIES: hypothetical protein [unclassified Helicobacter]MDO7253560.1 hypothetical protein [Helicobacter sp. faydin-H75]MDP2539488.1 hypothetical protein [Helicobacter sp. faydin-H76]